MGTSLFADGALEVYKTPKLAGKSIVFTTHRQYGKSHHNTDTMFQNGEVGSNLWDRSAGGSKLVLASFDKDGNPELKTLVEAPDGIIRDPDISFDAKKVVFSMRRNKADSFKIYVYDLQSGKTDQLTKLEDSSDLEPIWLPTGEIVFSSTRAAKYCGCNRHIMCNLYRMNPDGSNILQIGNSIEFEHAPSVMRDGRILYTRWEYVDRNFGGAQGLWTCNPDGTRHALYWGQETSNPSIGGVQMPDSSKVVSVLASCHDRPWGALVLIDRNVGIEGEKSVLKIFPKDARHLIGREKTLTEKWGDAMWPIRIKYEDPYPVSENLVLVSRYVREGDPLNPPPMGLWLVDFSDDSETLVAKIEDKELQKVWDAAKDNGARMRAKEFMGVFSAKPVSARKAAVIADQRGSSTDKSYVYISDVYEGTHMKGIKRGDIKYIRVVENAPKLSWSARGWSNDGEQAPAMNYEDYAIKVDLGVVEVEKDGSAYFEVPSDKFVYFQALDKDKNMLQSMRSGLVVLPGEISSCTGCHESRYSPPPTMSTPSLALRKPPQVPRGAPETFGKAFDYMKMIQPIFDKHCMDCHDAGNDTGLTLSRDKGLVFNRSYMDLHSKKLINVVGAGPNAVQEANTWGAKHSVLMSKLDGTHNGVKLSDSERDAIRLWIDLNAPYYATHDSAYPANLAGRSPLTFEELKELAKLSGNDGILKSHARAYKTELVSFDRPQTSEILKKFKKGSPEYARALEIIGAGARRLKERPRADMENFRGMPIDEWRAQRYEKFRQLELLCRKAVDEGGIVHDPQKLDMPTMPGK